LTASNTCISNSLTFLAKLGFAGQTTLMINGLSGAWGVVTTFIFITFIVDKLGRRKPLIIGPILMAVCLAWQSAIGKQFSQPGYSNFGAGVAGVASFFCFSWAFGWSFGPVSWIYQSEIFPMNLRAMGSAASTASNWLNNVIIGQVTPIGLNVSLTFQT
jgi:MFS family permease